MNRGHLKPGDGIKFPRGWVQVKRRRQKKKKKKGEGIQVLNPGSFQCLQVEWMK